MKWRVIPAALVIVALAAACGDDDGDGDESGGLGDLVSTTTVEETDGTDETTTTEGTEESTTTTEADGADLPDGMVEFAGDGFTVGLPEGWQDGEAMLSNPEFAAMMEELLGGADAAQQALSELDLIAFETASLGTGFANNINVIVSPLSPSDSLDAIESQIGELLNAQLGANVTTIDRVDVGGTEAVRIEYDYDLQGSQLLGVQYYVLGDENSAVATFTTHAAGPPFSVFDEIMETFRFTR